MIATAKPGTKAAVEIVAGTNNVVRGQADRIRTRTHERTEPTIAPARLIAALSPRIIRNTRLRLQPTARKMPSSFVRSMTDINIVLRMLANDSDTTIAVIAHAEAPPSFASVAVLTNWCVA